MGEKLEDVKKNLFQLELQTQTSIETKLVPIKQNASTTNI